MAQVWLSYDELGDMFGCQAAAARAKAIESGWPRRQCSDGISRVKLPPAAAHEFMVAYAVSFAGDGAHDVMVASLRGTLDHVVSQRRSGDERKAG